MLKLEYFRNLSGVPVSWARVLVQLPVSSLGVSALQRLVQQSPPGIRADRTSGGLGVVSSTNCPQSIWNLEARGARKAPRGVVLAIQVTGVGDVCLYM